MNFNKPEKKELLFLMLTGCMIGILCFALVYGFKIVDVTYNGINEKSIFNTVIENGSAILNAYKIWLQSSADDYIRNYNYAGFFDDYLNRYPLMKVVYLQ